MQRSRAFPVHIWESQANTYFIAQRYKALKISSHVIQHLHYDAIAVMLMHILVSHTFAHAAPERATLFSVQEAHRWVLQHLLLVAHPEMLPGCSHEPLRLQLETHAVPSAQCP
jgi:hypothetical protein